MTADQVLERLAGVGGKRKTGVPCTAAKAVSMAREVDADVAEVIRVALASEGIPAQRLSAELADLGVEVSEYSILRHRRGLRGEKGRSGCRCEA